MADKEQIIIDGVNVSGCDFICVEDDYCSYSGITRAYKGECGCSDEEMCKDNPKCFYKKALKQLQRNQAQYNAVVEQNKSLQQDLKRKTAECEALKEKYKWYDHYKDSALANKDLCNKKIDEIGRCREALEEIKGIACNEMCDMLGHFCAGCDDKPSCKTLKILDIISKVKGEENAR